MADPRLNLKNRNVAAVLAFLIPGAGHWYQGRCFKAAIYSVCILSTFFWGQAMAEWKGVYFRWQDFEGNNRFRTRDRTIGYLSQVLVGLPSLPAFIQWQRYSSGNDAESRDFTKFPQDRRPLSGCSYLGSRIGRCQNLLRPASASRLCKSRYAGVCNDLQTSSCGRSAKR